MEKDFGSNESHSPKWIPKGQQTMCILGRLKFSILAIAPAVLVMIISVIAQPYYFLLSSWVAHSKPWIWL